MALRYGLLTTLYLTPTLYAFLRSFPGDARLIVLNNSWEAVDVTIPIHANPRLPTLACCHLPNGLRLIDELDPSNRTQIVDGNVRVHLPGKRGAVYRGEQGAAASLVPVVHTGVAELQAVDPIVPPDSPPRSSADRLPTASRAPPSD
jgi:hypothetical protein